MKTLMGYKYSVQHGDEERFRTSRNDETIDTEPFSVVLASGARLPAGRQVGNLSLPAGFLRSAEAISWDRVRNSPASG